MFAAPLLSVMMLIGTQPGPEVVRIDLTDTRQVIEGFGAAVIVFGGEDRIDQTNPETINLIVNDLGASIVRVPMPQEFEWRNDNDDPFDFNWDGFKMEAFANESGASWRLRLLQQFQEAGVERFLASTWSPPGHTKTHRSVTNAGYLRMDRVDEYAEYMAAFLMIAKRNYGIDIGAVTLQNELLFNHTFRSTLYTGQQVREKVRAVMSRWEDLGITSRIFIPEDMQFYDRMRDYVEPTLRDPVASQFVGGFASHRSDGPEDLKRWGEFSRSVGQQNWMTETSGHQQTWDGAFQLAVDIHNHLVLADFNAWIYWQFTDRASAGVYAIMVDGQKTPKYFTSQHFYRYIRPGAYRVGTSHDEGELMVSAYRHDYDGTLTVVLINDSEAARNVQLDLVGLSSAAFEVFVSDRERGGEGTDGFIAAASLAAEDVLALPAESVVTLVARDEALKTTDIRPAWPEAVPVEPGPRWGDYSPVDLGPGWNISQAALRDITDALRAEIAQGNVNALRYDGRNALFEAILAGAGDAATALIAAGIEVNHADLSGWTPLHMAAATWGPGGDRPGFGAGYRLVDFVDMVLAAGGDVAARDETGWTPLHAAAANGRTRDGSSVLRIERLIEAGAEVDARCQHGRTPLHYAAWQGFMAWILAQRHDMASALIAAGADVNALDEDGRTPLHYAALMGHDPIVIALLLAGADADLADNAGETAQTLAESRANATTLQILATPLGSLELPGQAEEVADVDEVLAAALLDAAWRGDLTRVRELLAEGADPHWRDGDGFRAIDRARDNRHTEIVELLERAMREYR